MARRRASAAAAAAPAATSDRRRSRAETTPSRRGNNQIGEPPASSNRKLIAILVIFFVIIPAVSVLVYTVKLAPREDRTGWSVHRRGLVRTNVGYREILDEHLKVSENISNRNYNYPVLAYITPWNSKGYEMAKIFNSRFTHLSPVWYEIRSQGSGLVLEGKHNADKGWIQELRAKGNALILPRVVLEAFPEGMLRKKKLRDKAVDLIVTECKEMEYDGIVLESWSRWAGYGILHDPELREMALQFVKELGDALHSVTLPRRKEPHMELVYVIGPRHSEKLHKYDFGPEDLQRLKDSVDGFSLMTYDFSSPQNPGPNAPLKWIDLTLQHLLGSSSGVDRNLARKILLGINFYGNDFSLSGGLGGGAITGRDYLSLLEKQKPAFQYDEKSGEHFFVYTDDKDVKHVVFYPTLMSIHVRLEAARLWGTGISIWEIGQGLDYFFDLL